MSEASSIKVALWFIIIGLLPLSTAVYGIVKGEVNPYQLGVPRQRWCSRKERPVFFWICIIGGLLIGFFLSMTKDLKIQTILSA